MCYYSICLCGALKCAFSAKLSNGLEYVSEVVLHGI
uniref:Uncharacterized protein n=1 Tax=Anguilla anguilla TaxID=7936 RepID=A0A0E9XXG5_ANGAN